MVLPSFSGPESNAFISGAGSGERLHGGGEGMHGSAGMILMLFQAEGVIRLGRPPIHRIVKVQRFDASFHQPPPDEEGDADSDEDGEEDEDDADDDAGDAAGMKVAR